MQQRIIDPEMPFPQRISGHPAYPALAYGSQLFHHSILDEVGYLPEEGGLYGHDDVLWMMKIWKKKKPSFYIADMFSEHLGEDAGATTPYRLFKDEQMKISGKNFEKEFFAIYGRTVQEEIDGHLPETLS